MYTRREQWQRKKHDQKPKKTHKYQAGPQQPTVKVHVDVEISEQLKTQSDPKCQCDPTCTNPPLAGKSPFCAKHSKKGACKIRSPLSGWEPHYTPTLYNGTKRIRHNHNCFAYAFDVMDPPTDCTDDDCKEPFHQPGYASGYGKIGEKKFCAELLSRLKGDMPWIELTTFTAKCKPGYSKIAIVIDPNNDYHFYRQDSNGFWSHKPGGQPVINLDASNKLIYNPELCNRDYRTPGSTDPEELNYSIFCSFLQVPRNRPVHAKRGGGYFLGGAISMKGGTRKSTRKVTKKLRVKGGGHTIRKKYKTMGIFGKTPHRRRFHPFSMKYRPSIKLNISNINMTNIPSTTNRRYPTRFRTPRKLYTNIRTVSRKQNNVNLVPKMELTDAIKNRIRIEFDGAEFKKTRAYLYRHPEQLDALVAEKNEKQRIDDIVMAIDPISGNHIKSLYPGEDDKSKKIRHLLYVKLAGKPTPAFDDFLTTFMGLTL